MRALKRPIPFGKYLLLERVNVGGMAEVFVAKTFGVEGFERIVAIKKILPTMVEDEEFITMFIDEARIAVQLNHANVTQIFELGKHEDNYYIAMEYVSGRDLRVLLDRYRRRGEIMPTAQAVYVVSKICDGLDYAHRKKDARGMELHIVHRDVSPQNILLSYDGDVKVIDFGIAKAANRAQKTQAGILKGKFGYMSPEQVRGLPIDHRSDIFAVGVILYECLTGEKLFVGESDFSTLEKVRNADVDPPRKFNDSIPPGLENVVMKALAREPEDRYQWASDLQEDLMRFLLAGDTVFSNKHLAAYMKDAFAEDVKKEAARLESFMRVPKPDDVESSVVTATPTPVARPAFAAARPPEPEPPPDIPTEPRPAPRAAPRPPEKPKAPDKPRKVDPIYAAAAALGHDLSESDGPVEDRTEIFRPTFDSSATVMQSSAGMNFDEPAEHATGDATVMEGMQAVQDEAEPTDPGRAPANGRSTPEPEHDEVDPEAGNKTVARFEPARLSPPPGSGPAPRKVIGPPIVAADEVDSFREDEPPQANAGWDGGLGAAEEGVEDSLVGPPTLQKVPTKKKSGGSALKLALIAGGGAFALVLALIGVWAVFLRAPAAPAVGTVVVLPDPPDAKLSAASIDGRALDGGAPWTVRLKPGRHEIEVTGAGGQKLKKSVEVAAGAEQRVLMPVPTGVDEPVAAKEPGGEEPTPAEPKPDEPKPDEPTVAAKVDEPKPEEPKPDEPAAKLPDDPGAAAHVVEAPPKDPPKPEEPKAAAPTTFVATITSEPEGAAVKLGGKKVGSTPYTFDAEAGKTYVVEVLGPEGYGNASVRRVFEPTDAKIRLVLEKKAAAAPKPEKKEPPKAAEKKPESKPEKAAPAATGKKKGFLIAATKPAGAEVFVDGKSTGQVTPIPPARKLELPVGNHKITFKLDGKKKHDVTVTVKEGEITKVTGIEL